MNGMEMMLKSLGLNPKEIMETIQGMGNMVITMKTQMDEIQAQQARLEAKQDAILAALETENKE